MAVPPPMSPDPRAHRKPQGTTRHLRRLLSLTYLSALVTLLVPSLIATAVGGRTAVITSGSMGPRLRVGDLVVTRPADPPEPVKGQVVLVDDPATPGQLLTHRVFERREDGSLVLKGDANRTPDSGIVTPAHVLGVGWVAVPRVGLINVWIRLRDPRFIAWAGITTAALVLARGPHPPRGKGVRRAHDPSPARRFT